MARMCHNSGLNRHTHRQTEKGQSDLLGQKYMALQDGLIFTVLPASAGCKSKSPFYLQMPAGWKQKLLTTFTAGWAKIYNSTCSCRLEVKIYLLSAKAGAIQLCVRAMANVEMVELGWSAEVTLDMSIYSGYLRGPGEM